MSVSAPPSIVVNSNPALNQVILIGRYLVVLLSGLGLLSRFLSPAQISYVQSADFITTASALFGAGAVVWAYIETALQKKQLVAVAKADPAQVTVK